MIVENVSMKYLKLDFIAPYRELADIFLESLHEFIKNCNKDWEILKKEVRQAKN